VLDGQRIEGWSPERVNRRGLARSFQITNIFPRLSVFENVRIAVMQRRRLQYTFWRRIESVAAIREETERLLERVRLQHQAHTLGGEMTYSSSARSSWP
jgi:branched-chain amino acid transport system ATP-binding protein